MHFVLLAVIVIALLFLSTRQPKLAFGILGAMVVAIVIAIFVTQDSGSKSRAKISPDVVNLENTVVTQGYGGGFRLDTRISNQHESASLKEVVLGVTLLDCQGTEEGDCTVLGQKSERINIKIPAGQSRDIYITLNFGTIQPVGTLQWKYKITETRS